MSDNVIKKMQFEKVSDSGIIETCVLEQFDDGGVYVVGEELGEIIFEFAPDNLANALSKLAVLGYRPAGSVEEC